MLVSARLVAAAAAALVLLLLLASVSTLLQPQLSPMTPPPVMIKHKMACTDNACRVHFTSQNLVVHEVELVPQHRSLFADDMIIEDEDGKEPRVINKMTDVQHVMYETKPGEKLWGTAIVDPTTNTLVSGLFLTKDDQVIEHNIKATRHHRQRRQLEEEEEDKDTEHVVLEMPGIGQPWLKQSVFTEIPTVVAAAAAAKTTTTSSFSQLDDDDTVLVPAAASMAAARGAVTPFFPGCFKGDAVTQVFKMNVAYDYGLASTFPSTAAALADLDVIFSAGKLVILSQLNIRLELGKVTLGTANSALPLNRGAGGNQCANALAALPEMTDWAKTQPRTGFTLLMSKCFSGVTGTSYIGSACSTSYNANVAAHSWIIAFHELGHAFGMSHSFENGVGNTGGLMDYGNGLYNGVYQFHPNKKSEVCSFLDYSVSSCPFFTASDAASSCGDGILSKGETCECVQQGKKSCGNCKNCQAAVGVECSSKDFVFRTPSMPNTVIVANVDYMADSECCTAQNKFAPAKTLCGANKLNACSAGQCKQVCTQFLDSDNANCGFDASGCMLGCVYSNQCTFSLSFNDQLAGGAKAFVSSVGDGTRCVAANGRSGTCANRVCSTASAPTTGQIEQSRTLAPTKRPTATPSKATKSPTNWPTKKPSKRPTKKPTKRKTTG